MARNGGTHGDLRGLPIPDFTDHYDIGILPEDGGDNSGDKRHRWAPPPTATASRRNTAQTLYLSHKPERDPQRSGVLLPLWEQEVPGSNPGAPIKIEITLP